VPEGFPEGDELLHHAGGGQVVEAAAIEDGFVAFFDDVGAEEGEAAAEFAELDFGHGFRGGVVGFEVWSASHGEERG
jgi:hypothetical protein